MHQLIHCKIRHIDVCASILKIRKHPLDVYIFEHFVFACQHTHVHLEISILGVIKPETLVNMLVNCVYVPLYMKNLIKRVKTGFNSRFLEFKLDERLYYH